MKILDLTAGNRAIWHDKQNPLATYLDIRPEMKPDHVCDTRNIPAHVGSGFNLIVYDPPHCNMGPTSDMAKKYGHFTTKEILDSVEHTSIEAHRVGAPGALLIFKWATRDIKLERVLALMTEKWQPLFGDITKFSQRSKTHWLVLKRRD